MDHTIETLIDDIGEKITEYGKKQLDHDVLIKQIDDELREIKAKGGRLKMSTVQDISTAAVISQAFGNSFNDISALTTKGRVMYNLVLKDAGTITSANSLTGNAQASYASAPVARPRRKLHFRDLVQIIRSSTGTWKFYRHDNPAGEGSFEFQTTHGNPKAQVDYDLTEVTITADYLAGFVRIAKQMLQDLPFMQTYVSNELVEDYLRKEDNAFFGSLYSAATGAVGSSSVTAERIIQTVANLADKDFDPNGIIVTHQVWAKLLVTKPSDYSIPGGVTISPTGEIMIAGIPVFRTNESNIGNNKILVGDWSKVGIIEAEGLNVTMSESDSDNFQRNLVSVKAEARVALAVLNPAGFAYGNAGTT